MKRRTARLIRVFRSPLNPARGRLVGPGLDLPCGLGRAGTTHRKREGDGATPVGRFRALAAYWRPDRLPRPRTALPLVPIRRDLGWSDDPADRRYNRPVPLPSPFGHECMWREDALYDLLLDLSVNRGPIVPGHGSAIFLHSARPGFRPTEGCVAVDRRTVARLVERIGPGTVIEIVGRGMRRIRRTGSGGR
ncbi:MAG: L,D-transpeptidase catalytic domain protein [Enterovirga sp.]|nr:L,D-transpeptidase catalytic domain protein [Enterovirga sp.]